MSGPPIRLAVLGLSHESNSFAPGRTGLSRIEAAGIHRGQKMRERFAGGTSTIAGFLDVEATRVSDRPVELAPLLYTFPTPGPVLDDDAFETVVSEMVASIRNGMPWDGVLLGQHGSAVTSRHPDADAEVARRIRALVGDVPIGLATDMHANLSQDLVDASDVIVGYRSNPHLDARPRAAECATLVATMAATGRRPYQALMPVPIAISIAAQLTGAPPMVDLLKDLDRVLETPGIATASIAEGYQYADVPWMGMAAYVAAWSRPALAMDAAGWLASRIWERRGEMVGVAISVLEAVRRAVNSDSPPVLLLDSGDNIGGGSGGDSTALLTETIRQRLHPTLVILDDAQAVTTCIDVGIGSAVSVDVGGRIEATTGPVRIDGVVRTVRQGRFRAAGSAHAGMTALDPGTCAVIDTVAGDVVVLTSQIVMPVHLAQLQVLGVSVSGMRAVIAKGVQSPRPAYEPVCGEVIVVDSPGSTTLDLGALPYRHRRVPLYPFEEPEPPHGTSWRPG